MRISVNADNREYSVQIGPGMIKEEGLFTGFRRAAVVTDETVAKLQLDTIMATLERAKVRAGSIILPPGEEIKSRDRLFDIYSGLMDNLIGRSDAVIAFGGGTIGDAAGFAQPRTGGACHSYTVPPRCWPRRIPPSGERWP